jgi:hypothetical protein
MKRKVEGNAGLSLGEQRRDKETDCGRTEPRLGFGMHCMPRYPQPLQSRSMSNRRRQWPLDRVKGEEVDTVLHVTDLQTTREMQKQERTGGKELVRQEIYSLTME